MSRRHGMALVSSPQEKYRQVTATHAASECNLTKTSLYFYFPIVPFLLAIS